MEMNALRLQDEKDIAVRWIINVNPHAYQQARPELVDNHFQVTYLAYSTSKVRTLHTTSESEAFRRIYISAPNAEANHFLHY